MAGWLTVEWREIGNQIQRGRDYVGSATTTGSASRPKSPTKKNNCASLFSPLSFD